MTCFHFGAAVYNNTASTLAQMLTCRLRSSLWTWEIKPLCRYFIKQLYETMNKKWLFTSGNSQHWLNVHNLHDFKIQDGGGCYLRFRKMSITPNWIELFAPNVVGRRIAAMRRWHMVNSQNRKLLRVTSSNECREHRCDDLKALKSSQLTDLYFKPMQNSLTCSRYCLGY